MTAVLSPGMAQAGLALLEILERQTLTTAALVEGLRDVGGMQVGDVLAFSQALDWLAVGEDGILAATAGGRRLAGLQGYGAALRQIVEDYVARFSPGWLQNATYGRARVLAFSPPGVRQVLVEAGVAKGAEPEVVEFWDRLAGLARGIRADRLLGIGREGERLSLAYEAARTGAEPRWVSIDSNQDGYDVLSVCAVDDRTPLSVEVKASQRGDGFLHLTRNEWDQALDSRAHVFHLWKLQVDQPLLAVVTVSEMAEHVPSDVGSGEWQELRVPFSSFNGAFGGVELLLGSRPADRMPS
ncbi:hypothetical protein DMC25_00490 [Caulobacter sp. D4A]|uniref:DUF3883 domain-containing protein n=1 Tax=unclassified Caulobacter TaxID=2648921 RepID=UPI000D72820A|nr:MULTISPECIES: DUF3883 domain-containing protein [unclassified Caulobacter]PXA87721.1 hypothetical protein DMC18_20335 [Caulobacter sp. D5]PXA95594.1 hypothetical protein DMC25_00490 [Caulobacter sp. D4A]